jgi:ubiquitin carboxyl-terminal hydrolase 7
LQVYIRKSDLNTILCDVTEQDIPLELAERLQEEKELENVRQKEAKKRRLYIEVRLISEASFIGHQVFTSGSYSSWPKSQFVI